ncbi:MAG: hypothetical protein KDK54_19435 [Leptospiraceae bacterium]|nr:hypothetical protein [Leptospiraceae bacterium]
MKLTKFLKESFFNLLMTFIVLEAIGVLLEYSLSLRFAYNPGYSLGIRLGLLVSGLLSLLKLYFLNYSKYKNIKIQFHLMGAGFFMNLTVLVYYSFFRSNIPFLFGFFIANFINLKIFVLITQVIARNSSNE